MKEPKIRLGFIIINPNYEAEEVEWNSRGHWYTARNWVIKNNLEELYKEVLNNPDNKIFDYEEFLTDYIGAIKLHCVSGVKKAYIPRNACNNAYKSFLKRYFKSIGYFVYGDVNNDYGTPEIIRNECKKTYNYNQTVIINDGKYSYNPLKIGD